jgi:hypothetical protein
MEKELNNFFLDFGITTVKYEVILEHVFRKTQGDLQSVVVLLCWDDNEAIKRYISDDPLFFSVNKNRRNLCVRIIMHPDVNNSMVPTVIYSLAHLCKQCNLHLTSIILVSDGHEKEILDQPYSRVLYLAGLKDWKTETIVMNIRKFNRLMKSA